MRSLSLAFVAALLIAPGLGCGNEGQGEADSSSVGTSFDTSSGSSGSGESGDASSTSGSESSADATSGSTDTTGTSGGDGDGDGDTDIPICQSACVTVDDCAINSPAFDADNYSCDDGACRYTGCNSDAECQNLGNFVCRDGGAGYPTCVQACSSPADCDQGSPAFDADNYSCDAGACIYTGCVSDAECQATNATSVCHTFVGITAKACVPTCNTAADCSQGQLAFDADNYACEGGVCEYTGCNSDAECMEFQPLVCR